jgi:hypothetical protein
LLLSGDEVGSDGVVVMDYLIPFSGGEDVRAAFEDVAL